MSKYKNFADVYLDANIPIQNANKLYENRIFLGSSWKPGEPIKNTQDYDAWLSAGMPNNQSFDYSQYQKKSQQKNEKIITENSKDDLGKNIFKKIKKVDNQQNQIARDVISSYGSQQKYGNGKNYQSTYWSTINSQNISNNNNNINSMKRFKSPYKKRRNTFRKRFGSARFRRGFRPSYKSRSTFTPKVPFFKGIGSGNPQKGFVNFSYQSSGITSFGSGTSQNNTYPAFLINLNSPQIDSTGTGVYTQTNGAYPLNQVNAGIRSTACEYVTMYSLNYRYYEVYEVSFVLTINNLSTANFQCTGMLAQDVNKLNQTSITQIVASGSSWNYQKMGPLAGSTNSINSSITFALKAPISKLSGLKRGHPNLQGLLATTTQRPTDLCMYQVMFQADTTSVLSEISYDFKICYKTLLWGWEDQAVN